jgi:hypothetical protein
MHELVQDLDWSCDDMRNDVVSDSEQRVSELQRRV